MSAPRSTYRIQFRPQFGFAAALRVLDYLQRLGVDALYASPLLTPTPGSQHGYDVVDHSAANAELGGEDGRAALAEALRERGMGFVLDIVPNHMSVALPAANRWWSDVLRRGEDSEFAHYFDIDFTLGPILIPVLGDDSDGGAAALDALTVSGGMLCYDEHRFPLAEGTEAGTPQQVHQRQHYRLVSWRRGAAELTYRRFFDVSTLAALRVEDPEVLAATHDELLRWVGRGEVTGLRVDHPDGLTDPGQYLHRLRERTGCWLVVEKILRLGESLPSTWPVDGTTGYDALREICGVFLDPTGERQFTELAAELGVPTDFAEATARSRAEITAGMLSAEVRRIAALLDGWQESAARAAVAAVLGAFEVYRTYLPLGQAEWSHAVGEATRRHPELSEVITVLDRRVREQPDAELAQRMQQSSGMVVAKGTEDTSFYRCTRFVALNEVGGEPAEFGVSPVEFHVAAQARAAAWPHSMTTLSTHDTKRSEDVRARLAALAEIPAEFAAAVRRWSARAALPEPSLNLLGWQTLLGAWPIGTERLADYLDKAAKEAKLATSWLHRDHDFERTVRAWPQRVYSDAELCAEVAALVARIRPAGWSNSLGQKLVQLAGPGVPDVYQGSELWDYSLVDPDNRRAVDFAEREGLLAQLERGLLPEIDETGAAKLHVVRQALLLRRQRGELFHGYRPLPAVGSGAEHLLAFCRGERNGLVAVATRLPLRLAAAGGWGDTWLPLPGDHTRWTDVLTGRQVSTDWPAGRLLERYPVALLVGEGDRT
ncbi:MAG: malto-oligosyltrehalose synthase [Sciscionella sp.]